MCSLPSILPNLMPLSQGHSALNYYTDQVSQAWLQKKSRSQNLNSRGRTAHLEHCMCERERKRSTSKSFQQPLWQVRAPSLRSASALEHLYETGNQDAWFSLSDTVLLYKHLGTEETPNFLFKSPILSRTTEYSCQDEICRQTGGQDQQMQQCHIEPLPPDVSFLKKGKC